MRSTPSSSQRALHAPLHRLAGVVVRLGIASLLGLQHGVGRQAAALAQDEPDAPLALAVAVEGGGVDVGDGAVEGGADRRQRVLPPSPRRRRPLACLPSGAQPTAMGGTTSPVWPNGLRASGSAAVADMRDSLQFGDSSRPGDAIRAGAERQMGAADRYTCGQAPGRGGEMADTPALGAGGRKAVRVRIPLPAPTFDFWLAI